MAHDLIRSVKKAALVRLKSYAPLTALIAKTSIDPQAGTSGVNASTGEALWPFIRIDAMQAIPQGRRCNARSTVSFGIHAFAKPVYVGGVLTKTAEDAVGDIHAAVAEALHQHAVEYSGRTYRFAVTSTNLMQDGAEADAYHAIANVSCLVWWG